MSSYDSEIVTQKRVLMKDVEIDVMAILNDTVGTLMACAFKENSCQMGVIVGTGTNACYMEKLQNVHKLKGEWETDGLPDEMIINMEWGAFGDDGCLASVYTDYDKEIDQKSINPKKHLFEKMISGMYMGELVRIILERLARKGVLFKGEYLAISKRECFTTKHVSEVETAAHLVGAAIAQVLNRMNRPYRVTVGVDGSVYRFHPFFKRLLDRKIGDLINKEVKYQLMLSKDGSGIGAAVVAAVATRIKREITSRSEKTG
ncbi:Hexokinase [Ancylostoma caninum]|uniref:Phosphotransferase n=1 Tax=Ancylostoma caninum TaxID=29170 RepID=A0A368GQI9_ANCCA|nr:Hexokinase [Ancylostoma caninum]